MQFNLYQSQGTKALLSHPFRAWLLLFLGFVAAFGKEMTIACEPWWVIPMGISSNNLAAHLPQRESGTRYAASLRLLPRCSEAHKAWPLNRGAGRHKP